MCLHFRDRTHSKTSRTKVNSRPNKGSTSLGLNGDVSDKKEATGPRLPDSNVILCLKCINESPNV